MYSMHDGGNIEVHKRIAERFKPKTCVEVGTYYGGITYHLTKILPDCHFFAVQSYQDNKLNHVPSTNKGEFSANDFKKHPWKLEVKKHFPEEYHNFYDFNLLTKTFQDSKNVTIILDTSPFAYKWSIGFDLAIIDVSHLFEENVKQFNYWKQFGNKNSHILMGAYKLSLIHI